MLQESIFRSWRDLKSSGLSPLWESAPGPLCLDGVAPPALGFVLASLAKHRPEGTLLVVTSGVKAQEELANDLEAWGTPFLYIPQVDDRIHDEAITYVEADAEGQAERLQAFHRLRVGFSGVVLTTLKSLEQPLPPPAVLEKQRYKLVKKSVGQREILLNKLQAAGYQREIQVQDRGQFSVRGAVIDVFSWDAALPLRTEWEDEELISLREFDPAVQRSVRSVKEAELSLIGGDFSFRSEAATSSPSLDKKKKAAIPSLESAPLTASFLDYLPPGTLQLHFGLKGGVQKENPESLDRYIGTLFDFYGHDFLHTSSTDFMGQEHRRDLFLDRLQDWLGDDWHVTLFCNNEGEQKRLQEILEAAIVHTDRIEFHQRPLLRGFVWPAARQVVLTDAEIFGRYQTLRSLRKEERLVNLRSQHQALDFSEIEDGDYIVHLHHGIALYKGVTLLPPPADAPPGTLGQEVLVLEFAEQSKLYVPMEQAYLVTKYVGVGKRHPSLDTLGGSRWERAKISAQKAVMDYAGQLLNIQAERDSLAGHPFPGDNAWQREFEEAFVYEETEDQLRAIVEVKRDMERARPMDRLICGDVGFGKTEVAIRAIFKAIQGGRQCAFLVPTTVLAEQHAKTLRDRYASYPIRVECLNRLRSAAEQREILTGVQEGSIDVIVGTHRLLSKDVKFKTLGLVVIDEEQRFGVKQKEKFKQLFRLVDMLTLSATPIPRTLYLSLTGARDMSTIETAPAHRHPVETVVAPYDERLIRDAIVRELERNGQVFFLHNRINTLPDVALKIKNLVPKASIEIGHGQMEAEELEDVMSRFVQGKSDILLSTTIIESGIDIPNANTIIIDRADRFGLADLYQLRGRVGRAQHQAYAYLLLPRTLMGTGDARKRVMAIKQYSHLGAGFKIAMRDLEIRGAGNLLGTAQSGHITAVGFDLYCQLLKMAVAKMKGERPGRLIETKLQLDFIAWSEGDVDAQAGKRGAFLPRAYLPESRWRMDGYRRLAEAARVEDLQPIRNEWRDRYGSWPLEVEHLLLATEIRILASQARLYLVETQGEKLMMRQGQDFIMIGGKFPRLTATTAVSMLREICAWIGSLTKEIRASEPSDRK